MFLPASRQDDWERLYSDSIPDRTRFHDYRPRGGQTESRTLSASGRLLDIGAPKAGPSLGGDYDSVIVVIQCRRKRYVSFTLAPSFDNLSGYIACDLERFRDSPPLRHKSWQLIRSRKKHAFRESLDVDANR